MKYLLDTNHWSLLQRGQMQVVSRIRSLPQTSTLFMPVIAQAELLAGVETTPDGKRKSELRRLYDDSISSCAEVIPVTSPVAEKYAQIVASLRRHGKPIDTHDIWIAAIAAHHDLTVVSNDKHFRYIEELRVEDWSV
jgi:predicted nucleic acid-binding protein